MPSIVRLSSRDLVLVNDFMSSRGTLSGLALVRSHNACSSTPAATIPVCLSRGSTKRRLVPFSLSHRDKSQSYQLHLRVLFPLTLTTVASPAWSLFLSLPCPYHPFPMLFPFPFPRPGFLASLFGSSFIPCVSSSPSALPCS